MNGIVHSLFSFPLNGQSQKDTKCGHCSFKRQEEDEARRGEREDREEGVGEERMRGR